MSVFSRTAATSILTLFLIVPAAQAQQTAATTTGDSTAALAALAVGAAALALSVWVWWQYSRQRADDRARLTRLEQSIKSLSDQMAAAEARVDAALARDADERRQLAGQAAQMGDRITTALASQREDMARVALSLSLLPQGERQYRLKDLNGAMDVYRRALELNESSPLVHYRLGYIQAQRGELDQAEVHLEQALKLAPDFSPATAALGYVYRRRAENARPASEREKLLFNAEEKLRTALHQTPRLLDEDGESWWSTLGGLYRSLGNNRKAIRAYEEAAAITPYSSYPLGNLALYRGLEGDESGMLESFREVERLARAELQAAPDDFWPYADLLLARLALGKIQEAEETLNVLLKLIPPDVPHASASLLRALSILSDLVPANAATIADVAGHIREGAAPGTTDISLANETFVITSGDLPALAVRVSGQDDPARIVRLLDMAEPRPAVFILGGAVEMTPEEIQVARPVLEDVLAVFAQEHGAAIIDGGTRSGAMQLMGEARRKCRGTFPLVGVAPINLVRYNGHDNPSGYALDPNHSHFVLTSEGDWGDETDFIVQVAQALGGGKHPVLGIVINGGGIVRQEVYRLTITERLKAPLLVLEGSGRFADTLAEAVRAGEAEDSQLREIISKGRIEVVSVRDGLQPVRARLEAYFNAPPTAS